jgi:hypothetical protein
MALAVSDIIAIARISQYLASADIKKGSLFGKRVDPFSPVVLYCERKAVEYIYGLDASDTTLAGTANYLYSLCRGYNLQAQGILAAGGGGSISPINTSTAPDPVQFNVSATTAVVTGATTGTIGAFIGWNLLFVRGGIPQTTVNEGGGASYYSWDRALGTLTISPAAIVGELFQLYPI